MTPPSGTGRTIRPNTTTSMAMAAVIAWSRTRTTWTTSTTGTGTPHTTGTTTNTPIWTANLRPEARAANTAGVPAVEVALMDETGTAEPRWVTTQACQLVDRPMMPEVQ